MRSGSMLLEPYLLNVGPSPLQFINEVNVQPLNVTLKCMSHSNSIFYKQLWTDDAKVGHSAPNCYLGAM